ncbi:antirestriction protein ArdC [Sinorhizobium meliloti]
MPHQGGGIISESGGDYFSELGGEIISESGGGLPRNLQRKREKGSLVVKYGTFTPKDDDERAIPYLKGYTVFNVEQIENLSERFYRPAEELPATPVPHLETVETFVRNTGAAITYGGTAACYRPGPDDILMPDRARFVDEVHLYSTLLHEVSHWSGAKHRLDRDLSGRFGSESYSLEELVAELSASFLCADLGVAHDPRDNTATYLESWLKVLKNDKRAILTAAAKAQAAADYLHVLFQAPEASAAIAEDTQSAYVWLSCPDGRGLRRVPLRQLWIHGKGA